MKKSRVAMLVCIGAGAFLFVGAALAESIPAKPTKLAVGPRTGYLQARDDIPRSGGPLPIPGKAVPFPGPGSSGTQLLGFRGSGVSGVAVGLDGGSGGAAVAASTPQLRLEQSLAKIAKELR